MNLSNSFRQTLRQNWQFMAFGVGVLAFTVIIGMGFYVRGRNIMELQLKEKLRDTAAMGALQFDADIIDAIRGTGSMLDADFADVVARLGTIRETMPEIRYAYIMRRTEEPGLLEFVADADSLATDEELDENGNGTLDDDELASYPGDTYDASEIPALRDSAFLRPSVDDKITEDSWGEFISGYAPIRNANGDTVAIFGIDMSAEKFLQLTQRVFSPVVFLLVILSAVLFAGYVVMYMWNRRVETLRRIDQERSGLMLLTSHQLGTPLTIFQWTLESMRDSAEHGKLVEEFEGHAKNLGEGLERLRSVLAELKEASLAEQGAIPYKSEPGYLRDAVVEVVHAKMEEIRQRQQHVQMDLDGNLRLSFDHRLIGEVLRELIDNAMVFSKPQGVIRISARKRRGMVEVTVEDEGYGIPAKDLPRMFGKFVRGSNAHISRPDGNGLGLFIVRAIVEKAGGTIWLRSEEGKGTAVTFTLPLDLASR